MRLEIKYPENVIKIARILKDAGFVAYAVGGCMRDSVMGKTPADWDMTTDASPDEMLSIFESQNIRTIPTGLKHGTVSILLDGEIFECTTFRIDGEYADSRHPLSVEFTRDIKDDLCRRDFTMNALAGTPTDYVESVVIDLFGGIEDIDAKTVRSVGNAEKRFTEDALRILRAVRFATVLDFNIEEETMLAAVKLGHRLSNVSAERKNTELEKILLSDHADRGVCLLLDMGLARFVHCDIKKPRIPLRSLSKSFAVRLAALFEGEVPPSLSQMKLPGAVVKQVKLLCDRQAYENALSVFPDNPSATARIMISKFDSLAAECALMRGNDALYRAIMIETAKNPCVKLADLELGGSDLLSLGIEAKRIGKIMQELLLWVIENPEMNKRFLLLDRAASYKED